MVLLFTLVVNQCCLCLFKCISACLVLVDVLNASVVEMICVNIARFSQKTVFQSRRLSAGR